MARRAIRDTYAFEKVGVAPGDETEVRREVFAGTIVPDHLRLEDESAVEEGSGPPTVGLGAAPHGYKDQIGDDGQLLPEHRPGGGSSGGKRSRRSASSESSEE